jgi:predicted dehydrogenase
MVISGEIGTVKHVEASYLQSWLVSRAWGDWAKRIQVAVAAVDRSRLERRARRRIGIHILDFAAYGAATDVDRVFARLKTFDKAPDEQASANIRSRRKRQLTRCRSSSPTARIGVVHASRWATGHLNELKLRMLWRARRIW